MPIKFPKGFARRKSSGNALDELKPAPEPSFKVFERPASSSRTFDGPSTLNRLSGGHQGKPSLDDPNPDNIFAGIDRPATFHHFPNENHPPRTRAEKLSGSTGSAVTNHSSSGRLYDSSSSARFSSSSTLPSSTENSAHDIPVPPIPESSFSSALKAAGRTFSFGSKPPKVPPHVSKPSRLSDSSNRERAMTASTTSTATPPRLPDAGVSLDSSDDFSNIFAGLDDSNNQTPQNNHTSPPVSRSPIPSFGPPKVPPKGNTNGHSSLSPLHIDSSTIAAASPSPNSQTSRDSLIGAKSPREEGTPRPQLQRVRFSDDEDGLLRANRGAPPQSTRDPPGLNGNYNQATLSPPGLPFAAADPEVSSIYGTDDAFTHIPLNQKDREADLPSRPAQATPVTRKEGELSDQFTLAARYEELAQKNDTKPNKVMTPAQFERYREQKEMTRRESDASSSHSAESENEDEDEDDEAEQKRQAVSQRKKQEAHLSVYRQQMMKITGEQSKAHLKRESIESAGTPVNPNRLSVLDPGRPGQDKSSDGDGEDDDDVPLGILAAHGFPNKARPPSRLMATSSNPNLRASVQSFAPGPPSTAGEPFPPKRKTLPVFARNLPQDPYYGAGLINQPNRESLALGGGTPSVHGGQPQLPPGGLVGVIANEERARAMRRASPNTQANFELPGMNMPMMSPGPMGPMPGQNGMPTGDPNQMQVSQQMTQMMQTQIQWMQQMMQMQSMQMGAVPPGPNPTMLQPPGPNQRPMSMVSNGNTYGPAPPPQVDHRTLSMLDPQWNHNRQSSFIPALPDFSGPPAGYAPSVAPSERSNIGTASRYRPVSTMPPNPNRSSTFTANTPRPWAADTRQASFTSATPPPRANTTNMTIRPVSGLVNSAQNAKDDEDEDEGWAQMAKQREKKKSGWRFKKGTNGLEDLFHRNAV